MRTPPSPTTLTAPTRARGSRGKERRMGIGGGIFLIVVGAILAFAVSDGIAGVDLTMVGYICMAAGLIALVVALVMNRQRTNTIHTEYVERRDDRHVHGPEGTL